jgi:Flp pilus assembly protein TadG
MRGSQNPRPKVNKSGQSVVEVALTLPFLLLVILGLVEMGILFSTYIALVNATREGTLYASMHPELSNSTQTPTTSATWIEYQSRIADEVDVTVGARLREGQLLDSQTLTVNRPVIATSGTCANSTNIGCPITVTVSYQLHTFLNDVNMPVLGRFGLPNTYTMNYSMAAPIR